MSVPKPATIPEGIQKLRLFNDKAEKLARCSFIPKVFHSDHGMTIHFAHGEDLTVVRRGADEEATDALALTLRFFIQPRDGISIEQIEALYQALPLAEEYKRRASRGLENFRQWFDKPTGVVFEGVTITNRMLLDCFMYGDLAHANDGKRELFEKLTREPLRRIMEFQFEQVVADVLKTIFWFKHLNTEAIVELEKMYNSVQPTADLPNFSPDSACE